MHMSFRRPLRRSACGWHDRCIGKGVSNDDDASSEANEAIMESFAPEFFRYWLPATETEERAQADRRDEDARRQREALEQLAERVCAARTVV